jgi:rsbT co-antagonist protein RsbR
MATEHSDAVEQFNDRIAEILMVISDVGVGDFSERVEVSEDDDSPMGALCLGINEMVDVLEERERIARESEEQVREQSLLIMEMSTPVIKLWDDVLLLPLVGSLDTERSSQMTDSLLHAITEEGALVVVLDVTGIAVIDTSVARHLLTTVDSARILGAEVIITGFNPVAAQTLAQLGVDFSTLRTRGSLRAGVQEAFDLVNMKIVRTA